MTQTHTLQFAHRVNEDGTIDSICRDCFITVATALFDSDLEPGERTHHCEPCLIDWYKKCLDTVEILRGAELAPV